MVQRGSPRWSRSASAVERRHGPDDEWNDRDQDERWQRAHHQREAEPHGEFARRHLGMATAMFTSVEREPPDHRSEREAGTVRHPDRVDEGESPRAQPFDQYLECFADNLPAIDPSTGFVECVADDRVGVVDERPHRLDRGGTRLQSQHEQLERIGVRTVECALAPSR